MKKTYTVILGVHKASATAAKYKWKFQTPGPIGLKNLFSKYVLTTYHSKALKELSNIFKRVTGQKGSRKDMQKF